MLHDCLQGLTRIQYIIHDQDLLTPDVPGQWKSLMEVTGGGAFAVTGQTDHCPFQRAPQGSNQIA